MDGFWWSLYGSIWHDRRILSWQQYPPGPNVQYIYPLFPITIIWTSKVNDYGSKILRMTANKDNFGYLVVSAACLLNFLEIIGSLLVRLFLVIAYKILIEKDILNLSILLWKICFFFIESVSPWQAIASSCDRSVEPTPGLYQ